MHPPPSQLSVSALRPTASRLPYPREINTYLDKFVVGQVATSLNFVPEASRATSLGVPLQAEAEALLLL